MSTTDLSSIGYSDILLSAQQAIAAHPIAEQTNVNNTSQPGVTEQVRGVLAQTTTIPLQSTINYVSDISISAYMRRFPIDFFVYNMRPNRRVWPYFSDVDITKIVQKPNAVVLDNNKNYYSILPRTSTELSRITSNIIEPDYNLIPIPGQENLGFEVNDMLYPETWTSSDGGTIAGPIQTQSEQLFIGGGLAKIYYSEYNSSGQTVLYISEIQAINDSVTTLVANTVAGVRSSSISNVVSYVHNSGILRFTETPVTDAETVGGANVQYDLAVVRLAQDASNQDGYYVGNTFTILNGSVPGETVNITSYEGDTRKAFVSPPIKGVRNLRGQTNIIYSLGDPKVPYASGAQVGHYTSPKGFFGGTIHLPGPGVTSPYMFKTGEKLFKITDNIQNKSQEATTIAEYIFNSYGLNISRGQIIINNPSGSTVIGSSQGAVAVENAPALVPPVNDGILQNNITGPAPAQGYKNLSPIAQSFYISEIDYPKGIFVPYIDLFFASKGTLPVELQIRPIVNGYPDSKNIVPNAVAVVEAEEVNVTASPSPTNPRSFTRFTFNSPVYLFPGFEYSLIVSSNDYDYEIFVSELGEKVIGTDRIVSEQPFLGSLFKSQNGSTYSAIQTEDLMFVIHKCEFVSSGQIEFFEEKLPQQTYQYWQDHTYTQANSVYDTFNVHSDSIEIPGTTLNYSYMSTTQANTTIDSQYTEFKPDKLIILRDRKVLFGKQYPTVSFKMKVNLTTSSKDVSPIIYVQKQNLARTATLINNLEIHQNLLQIANTGNGYTTQNTSVVITANTGSGANAYPLYLIDNSANLSANGLVGTTSRIGNLAFDGQGSGYAEDVTLTVVTSDANVTPAVITMSSETNPSGGPALARYISKTINLAPEFNAGDLRVFLTALKPIEANIYVYYKVRNSYDNETIGNKKWVRMIEKTGPNGELSYTTGSIPLEFEYRPSFSSNTIVYSTSTATFDTFNEFKIKIVLASSKTTLDKIPYVFDMRAIALPGTE